jgi:hypothetical protein
MDEDQGKPSMMNSRLLFVVIAIAPLGCSEALQPEVASVGPKAETAAHESLAGPFVQAGTLFSVEVDQPIDTYYSAEGASFRATVVDPLFDTQGKLVVPYGAKLRGTIASVGTHDLPRLRLAFQSIDTVRGPAPIEAGLRDAQHYEWAGPDPLFVDTSSGPSYMMSRYGDLPSDAPSANLFGYQVEYGFGTTQPREVRIPNGAIMELALIGPLVVAH